MILSIQSLDPFSLYRIISGPIMNQTLDFEQADEARKLTDCSHNHVLHGLVKLRRESDETGRVRQRADASFPGHPDVGVSFAANQIHCLMFNAIFFF